MTIPTLFDRKLLRLRREKAEGQENREDFLLQEMAVRLADRLADVTRRFECALEIGSRKNLLADRLKSSRQIESLTHTALSPRLLPEGGTGVVADEEMLPFADDSFDLVLSCANLHVVNDLPGTLAQIHRVLKPDGLFLAIFVGGQTLHELRDAFTRASIEVESGAAPRIYPFVDVRDAGALLQRAKFSLPVIDSDRISVRYQTPLKLLSDIRSMGESSVLAGRSRKPLKRATLAAMTRKYKELWGGDEDEDDHDGRVPATFEFVTLTAWKPHSSQPKPLARGSGKISLAEVFKKKQ